MDSHPWKRDPHRKAYCNLGYLPSGFLPIETLEQCILNSRISAATKIQSVWRGYRCRKAFRENKSKLQETKAAIIIQRSVQEWLHKKNNGEFLLKPDEENVYYLEKVDEEKIPALQQKIDQWNRDNDANFECTEKLQLQLATVQEQLKSFYEKAATRNSRMKRCEAVCTQIEAIGSLLTDLPSLAHCDQVDISMFRTPLVSDARTARLRHKQQLKALHAPWWKRLNLQTEHIV